MRPRPQLTAILLSILLAGAARADVAGKTLYTGPAPQPKPNPNPLAVDESIVVGKNNALKNVVVYVKDGAKLAAPVPQTPALLETKGSRYVPHVLPVMVGQECKARNGDQLLHVVTALAKNNAPVELPLHQQGQVETLNGAAKAVETYTVRCGVHPWMKAWIVVLDHPFFAVTDDDGQFTIKGLKPGKYTLVAWQEKLGSQETDIDVGEDGKAAKPPEFKFPAKN